MERCVVVVQGIGRILHFPSFFLFLFTYLLLRYLRLSDAAPGKAIEWQEHQTIILFIVNEMFG
jgi:hypothetical protein